jgi:hypothetical protein
LVESERKDIKNMNDATEDVDVPAKAVQTFALSDFDTLELGETGVKMPVRRPDTLEPIMHGDPPRRMTLTVASADSDKFIKARRSAQDRRNAVSGRRGGPGVARAAEIDNDSIDMLVAVVLDWDITLSPGTEPPKFSPAAVRNLFTKFPYIMRQVDSFVADDANFLKASAKA